MTDIAHVPAPGPLADPARVRILVVDDIEDNRYTLGMFLELEGYTNVAMATDGSEALARLAAERFDLVLLDVMMPVKGGVEVLEHLQAQGRLHRLPVIMISAQQELDSVVRCIELGAEDYLPKPFNQTLLAARIRACLEKAALREVAAATLERMEAELASAREFQLSMVPAARPELPPEAGLALAAVLEPARELGGDFYDWFRVADDAWCVVAGDVCDKGVTAALFMARAMHTLRLFATRADAGSDPVAWLAAANEALCRDNAARMFVALSIAVVRPVARVAALVNAGGVEPRVVDAEGAHAVSAPRGRPLGVRRGERWRALEVPFAPGQSLVLCTDGVTEAMNTAGTLCGEGRYDALLSAADRTDPGGLLDGTLAGLHAFVGTAPRADDIALIVVSARD